MIKGYIFSSRMTVIIIPIKNVIDIGAGDLHCPFVINVGNRGIKAFASPWAKSPEKVLLPEIFRIVERMKEYPTIRRVKPQKFI